MSQHHAAAGMTRQRVGATSVIRAGAYHRVYPSWDTYILFSQTRWGRILFEGQ